MLSKDSSTSKSPSAFSQVPIAEGPKIGIVTILKTNNYGAELQAFALQYKLQKLGFNAEIIDFLFYKNTNFIRTRRAKPFVKIGLRKWLKEFLNPFAERLMAFPHRVAKKARDLRFIHFHETHSRFSPRTFRSVDELYNTKLSYDVYLVGSDQVWNPFSNINLEPYFLTFAPKGKKRISYASSFGVSIIPEDAQPIYQELLNNLDHISVREAQGVNLVQGLTGRSAQHVLDPTLLLDDSEWGKVASFSFETSDYLLLYVLSSSDYATQLAKKIAADLDLTLVRICKNAVRQDADDSIINIIDAGPAEFVGLFMNASFIITNSFHGTAFSVNFEKPFYTILPQHKSNNSRQEGLLSSLGLSNRAIPEGTSMPVQGEYFVDFSEARLSLVQARKLSTDFLVNAIKGSKHG